jgi:predicted nucleic acid-binding protein
LILVDTSVWVDRFRHSGAQLIELLNANVVVMHPFVIGEIACGSLADGETTLDLLQSLPSAAVAETAEILAFIESQNLYGKGIGYGDVHLLASVALAGMKLGTRDKRLHAVAQELGCAVLEGRGH